jgi:hypothetical protein
LSWKEATNAALCLIAWAVSRRNEMVCMSVREAHVAGMVVLVGGERAMVRRVASAVLIDEVS